MSRPSNGATVGNFREHGAQGHEQLGQQLTHQVLSLLRDPQHDAPSIVNTEDSGDQVAAHQGIADARHVGGTLVRAHAQIARMSDALRLREQGRQHAKLRLGETERAKLLFEPRGQLPSQLLTQAPYLYTYDLHTRYLSAQRPCI